MWEPWYERPGVWITAIIVIVVVLGYYAAKETDQTCKKIMSFAHTPSDSMKAVIACEQIKSDHARNAAIAAGAGAVAGSGIGGRR